MNYVYACKPRVIFFFTGIACLITGSNLQFSIFRNFSATPEAAFEPKRHHSRWSFPNDFPPRLEGKFYFSVILGACNIVPMVLATNWDLSRKSPFLSFSFRGSVFFFLFAHTRNVPIEFLSHPFLSFLSFLLLSLPRIFHLTAAEKGKEKREAKALLQIYLFPDSFSLFHVLFANRLSFRLWNDLIGDGQEAESMKD